MIGYRNVAYLPREGVVKLWTWDANGQRVHSSEPYRPYLYVEDNRSSDGISIYGTKVRQKIFNNQYDRARFAKDAGIKRLFENLPTNQQFLIDYFWQFNEMPEFGQFPLKVYFIDIEAVARDEFPDPREANHPINVVTIYDTLKKRKHVWGVGPFENSHSDVTYYHCRTEKELLNQMISFIERDYPDIISGWNSAHFDMPYIVNRIRNVMGEEDVKRLSPIGNVYSKVVRGMFGAEDMRWYIDGISCLDYLDLYKRFQLKNRDSYKLDNIAQIELGERKINYGNMHIAELAEKDWQTFVEYNIHDVYLLQRLDEELKYIELIRMLAYIGLTTFEAAMGAVAVINGAATIRARFRDQKIATFIRNGDTGKNPGAYVGEPLKGFQKDIVSFDANSLYPNLMISLNMSPETKVGKILSHDSVGVKLQYTNGEVFTLAPEKFAKLIKQENIAVSKAGILFSQNRVGIMPEMVDYYYNKRVEVKAKLTEVKQKIDACNKEIKSKSKTDPVVCANIKKIKSALELEENRLHTKQLTIKVLINSAYGYFGNKHSPIGDDDIASSITLSGQAVIKQSNIFAREFLQSESGYSDDYFKAYSPIIYNDTDSFVGDTVIRTDKGDIKIEDMWNNNINKVNHTAHGHEVKDICDISLKTYNQHSQEDEFRRGCRIFRHKVSKRLFKIKDNSGRSVIITEDHGLMVMRDGEMLRISPLDKLPGDKIITTTFD